MTRCRATAGSSVLSGTRRGHEIGCRARSTPSSTRAGAGGVTVVCDLPRRLTEAAAGRAGLRRPGRRGHRVRRAGVRGHRGDGPGAVGDQPERRPGRARAVARAGCGPPRSAEIAGLPLLAAMRPEPHARRAPRTRRSAAATAVAAGARPPGGCSPCWPAGAVRCARHERVADRPGARAAGRRVRPAAARAVVAAAIRAESGGSARRHRGADQPAGAADRTDRRRHPRAAAVRAGHHRRPGHRSGRGVGRRRKRACGAARFGSPTRPRCADWRSGWRWPPAGGSTTRSRGSTGS